MSFTPSVQRAGHLDGPAASPQPAERLQRKQSSLLGISVTFDPALNAPGGIEDAAASEDFRPAMPVGNRSVAVAASFRALSPQAALAQAPDATMAARMVRGARDLLTKGEIDGEGSERDRATIRVRSSRVAAAALEDEVSDEDAVVLLTPLNFPQSRSRESQRQPESAQELMDLLDGFNDPEELKELLKWVLENDREERLPHDAQKLHETIKSMIRRKEQAALVELLRKAQQIPEISEVRAQRRDDLHEQLGQMEHSKQGSLEQITTASDKEAQKTSNPEKYSDVFAFVVTGPEDLTKISLGLLQSYPPEQLAALGNKLKRSLAEFEDMADRNAPRAKIQHARANIQGMHCVTSTVSLTAAYVQRPVEAFVNGG